MYHPKEEYEMKNLNILMVHFFIEVFSFGHALFACFFVDEVAVGLDVCPVTLHLHGNMGPDRRAG